MNYISSKDFQELKQLVKNITTSQEEYAEKFGKDLFKGKSYTYEDVDFEEIAKANRE